MALENIEKMKQSHRLVFLKIQIHGIASKLECPHLIFQLGSANIAGKL